MGWPPHPWGELESDTGQVLVTTWLPSKVEGGSGVLVAITPGGLQQPHGRARLPFPTHETPEGACLDSHLPLAPTAASSQPC